MTAAYIQHSRWRERSAYTKRLFIFNNVQIMSMLYPRERNSSSSKAVKQTVTSSGDGRRGTERGGPPCAVSNCPPGSTDRSNISCSSVWPATTWGVTERLRQGEMNLHSYQGHTAETETKKAANIIITGENDLCDSPLAV